MDSAVIRVKRRITDEPFDKFVLNSKRAKMCELMSDENQQETNNSSDETRSILKLAATISVEDDITTHLTKLRKSEAMELAKKVRKTPNNIAKLRQQFKDDAKEQRYKVINCFRSMNEASTVDGADATAANFTVVDVIQEDDSKSIMPTPDTETTVSTNDLDPAPFTLLDEFVYDLYLFDHGEQLIEINPNDCISIRPFDDLVYQAADQCLDNSDSNDSEDSNDEGNDRNDYPDTDSDFSVKDDDIRIALDDLAITDEESSSDDDCVYGNDPKGPVVQFVDAESEDEFSFFKKFGRIRKHEQYYRNNATQWSRRADSSDSDTDIDEVTSTHSSHSSISQVSPLMSCNEDD